MVGVVVIGTTVVGVGLYLLRQWWSGELAEGDSVWE